MKKLLAVVLAVLMAVSFVGCKDNVTLTQEQNDLIAEYIAGTMLKYSHENKWKYTKLSIAQNTYVPSGTSSAQENVSGATKPSDTKPSGGNTAGSSGTVNANPLTSLPASLGLSDVAITINDVKVGSSYPTDALVFSVPALPGHKVAAVEMNLKNTSGSAITLNTISSAVNMKLNVGGNQISKSASLLKNDVTGLKNITLAAGESYTAVAVFQVEESIASQVEGSSLVINDGATSLGTITIQ